MWDSLLTACHVVRIWAGKHYVDKTRIGIWGWVSVCVVGFLLGRSEAHLVIWRIHELQSRRGQRRNPFTGDGGRGTFLPTLGVSAVR